MISPNTVPGHDPQKKSGVFCFLRASVILSGAVFQA